MKITFIGGGNMASALIGGLLRQAAAPADILVVEPQAAQRARLAETFGVTPLAAPEPAALASEVLVLAVKPQQMRAAIAPLAGQLCHQIVVSIAAGLTLGTLSGWLEGYRRIVRVMPNTPALIGAGMSGLCALPDVALSERLVVERILETAGAILWVEDEARMDAITAISGSGPAYLFFFIEALEKAAVELGFPAEAARLLAIETTLGAARLAADSGEAPAILRERVTSPSGTTAAALAVLRENGVAEGIIAGAKAAEARGRELSAQLADLRGNP
ncbi:MAG: pyrroline-5-carboxylate reductase [Zoogloeaceae bacterium]|jgi:pyrroline-5-carboxylate reductase|nr:pyrroline-5-carboxylate reductase [Zoogloeaceae bacterium]